MVEKSLHDRISIVEQIVEFLLELFNSGEAPTQEQREQLKTLYKEVQKGKT